VDGLLGSYLRGQLLLCLIVGGMATIALILLGIDAALLLGTIAGVLELIPILGPYMGALPAVLIALVKEPILALWTALAFAAIQQIENLFLVPRISGNAVRFHPALVMVIVLMGSQLAGLWGLLVAVPVAAMIRDVYAYLYLRTTERGATPEMALETLRARTL
jgi:predicted PurR-regulated permease PerM